MLEIDDDVHQDDELVRTEDHQEHVDEGATDENHTPENGQPDQTLVHSDAEEGTEDLNQTSHSQEQSSEHIESHAEPEPRQE